MALAGWRRRASVPAGAGTEARPTYHDNRWRMVMAPHSWNNGVNAEAPRPQTLASWRPGGSLSARSLTAVSHTHSLCGLLRHSAPLQPALLPRERHRHLLLGAI